MVGGEGAVDPRRHRVLGIDFIADKCGGVAPSCEDQAAVICKVLDRSGVDQAHAVVGASYGGMVALSLGQHFPARVKRIVVISAGASDRKSTRLNSSH